MEQKKFHTKSILKQFRKHLIIGGGILLIIILVLAYSANPKEAQEPVKESVDTAFSAVKNQTPGTAEVMQQHLTTFEANQQKINQQNADKIAQLESENQAYKQAAVDAESNAAKINEKLAKINSVKADESATIAKQQYKPQKMVLEDDINDVSGGYTNVSASDVNGDIKSNESNIANVDNTNKTTSEQNVATYIPSNSFTKNLFRIFLVITLQKPILPSAGSYL